MLKVGIEGQKTRQMLTPGLTSYSLPTRYYPEPKESLQCDVEQLTAWPNAATCLGQKSL